MRNPLERALDDLTNHDQAMPTKGIVTIIIEGTDIVNRTHYVKMVTQEALDKGTYKKEGNIYRDGLVTIDSHICNE